MISPRRREDAYFFSGDLPHGCACAPRCQVLDVWQALLPLELGSQGAPAGRRCGILAEGRGNGDKLRHALPQARVIINHIYESNFIQRNLPWTGLASYKAILFAWVSSLCLVPQQWWTPLPPSDGDPQLPWDQLRLRSVGHCCFSSQKLCCCSSGEADVAAGRMWRAFLLGTAGGSLVRWPQGERWAFCRQRAPCSGDGGSGRSDPPFWTRRSRKAGCCRHRNSFEHCCGRSCSSCGHHFHCCRGLLPCCHRRKRRSDYYYTVVVVVVFDDEDEKAVVVDDAVRIDLTMIDAVVSNVSLEYYYGCCYCYCYYYYSVVGECCSSNCPFGNRGK